MLLKAKVPCTLHYNGVPVKFKKDEVKEVSEKEGKHFLSLSRRVEEGGVISQDKFVEAHSEKKPEPKEADKK